MTANYIQRTSSIKSLHEAFLHQEVSPFDVTRAMLDRIGAINPEINAFITVNSEQALEEAKASENRYKKGDALGLLDGIPYSVKDIIFTSGLRTTMGCGYYDTFCPEYDAEVVRRLRHAGAVMLGKNNTHQFALGSTGDRSAYGPVHNPYDLSKIAGGSSSGSAAAVACGMSIFSIGTDTGGSIRVPACFCGCCAMKPTYARASTRGIFPASISFDTVGVISSSPEDNAIVLSSIVGYDADADFSLDIPKENYLRLVGKSVSHKISIPKSLFQGKIDREIENAFWEAISVINEAGIRTETVAFPEVSRYRSVRTEILMAEAYGVHKDLYESKPEVFDIETIKDIESGRKVATWKYISDLHETRTFKRIFSNYMDEVGILAVPGTSISPIEINYRGTVYTGKTTTEIYEALSRFNWFSSMSGCPAIVIPIGKNSNGMPIGMQLVGRALHEAELYQIADIIYKKYSIV